MNQDSVLTVVIPTFHRPSLLENAIQSVLRSPCVARPTDVFVVDDAGETEARGIAESLGVNYVTSATSVAAGPSRSRNRGLELCETEFIAFLDDDDEWLTDNPLPQMSKLQSNSALGMAFGQSILTDQDLNEFGLPFPDRVTPKGSWLHFFLEFHSQLGAMVFRTEAVRQVGGFDPGIRYGEDTDLLLRLADRFPVEGCEFRASHFRQRPADPRDSENRWLAYADHRRMMCNLMGQGVVPVDRLTRRYERETRGRTSFHFRSDAAHALRDGRKGDALRCITRSVRVSPLHAVRLPLDFVRLWSATGNRR